MRLAFGCTGRQNCGQTVELVIMATYTYIQSSAQCWWPACLRFVVSEWVWRLAERRAYCSGHSVATQRCLTVYRRANCSGHSVATQRCLTVYRRANCSGHPVATQRCLTVYRRANCSGHSVATQQYLTVYRKKLCRSSTDIGSAILNISMRRRSVVSKTPRPP
jgi:hypothetical protein